MATIEIELWQKAKWVWCFCGHLEQQASARNVRVRKHTGNVKNGWMKVSNLCAYTLDCVTYSVRRDIIASSHAKEKVTFRIMPYRIVRTTLKELYTLNFAIFDSI